MDKRKGEIKKAGTKRNKGVQGSAASGSRLIRLHLDEEMMRGTGDDGGGSLIRLFSGRYKTKLPKKNPALVWIFKDWRVEKGHNKITNWRNLFAVCYETKSKKTKELPVYYQQWGLTGLNAHSVNAPDYTDAPPGDASGAAKSIVDAIFDIIEVVASEKGTDETTWNNKMTIENGNDVCDRLNLYWRKQ